jgi:UDP-N-acetylmuramoyl-L-alanyl-D-glutamate--2,6-diaminopimelate ligase
MAPVWGMFNVHNLLAVVGTLLAAGAPIGIAAAAVSALTPVPGRMNALGGERAPLVVIDYAHTPDALEKALQALRPVATQRGGRLVLVFGCGGDRDAGKRPLMGELAARNADTVILTSDNPRSEDPQAILDQIAVAAPGARVVADRANAIALAISVAAQADLVLVAGKGHETYQEVAGRRLPFSDHDVALKALENRSSVLSGDRP